MACPIADGAVEVMECGLSECPRDCSGEWGPWARCTAACGGGQQLRHYVVLEAAANGGIRCVFGGAVYKSNPVDPSRLKAPGFNP
jgi:hypothetical protein